MAQLVKHLPLKREDQSSNLQNSRKSHLGMDDHLYPKLQDTETGGSRGKLASQASQSFKLREKPCLGI